jgi:hypothetical protein
MGEQGYGQLTTTRCDRLPEEVPEKYLTKKKTDTKMGATVARFQNPVTMIVYGEYYGILVVTFHVLILYILTVCMSGSVIGDREN